MIQILFSLVISFQLLVSIITYDFSLPACSANTRQQSPININSQDSLYFEEKYFRFLTNNYIPLSTQHSWQYFDEEKAVGVGPVSGSKDLGSFTFVKDWAMYSFKLQKILFRSNSEHQLNGKNYAIEMQLIHSLDTNYFPPGRRIDLGVNNLVISIFFDVTDDTNPGRTKLFEFMNLSGFANSTNATMTRNIKLHHIIQHQPSYLYTGTLTYPECQPSLYLVFSQYHLIGVSDKSKLSGMIEARSQIIDPNTKRNTRNIFPTNVPIYRNWREPEKMTAQPTLMSYNTGSYLKIGNIFILAFFLISIFRII